MWKMILERTLFKKPLSHMLNLKSTRFNYVLKIQYMSKILSFYEES